MKIYRYNGKANISGEKIRRRREELHLSQEDVVAKLQLMGMEIGQNTLSRIESGIRFVPDYELKFFSRALEVPVEYFLNEEP